MIENLLRMKFGEILANNDVFDKTTNHPSLYRTPYTLKQAINRLHTK